MEDSEVSLLYITETELHEVDKLNMFRLFARGRL